MKQPRVEIPEQRIAEFCRQHRIRRLALFGSVLRDDLGPESDVDVLVEFEPGARVGLLRLAGMDMELSRILGRKVDLNTPGFLSDNFRSQVLAEAQVQYDAASRCPPAAAHALLPYFAFGIPDAVAAAGVTSPGSLGYAAFFFITGGVQWFGIGLALNPLRHLLARLTVEGAKAASIRLIDCRSAEAIVLDT
jgi:predicted nucleotidyltransferase